MRVCSQQAGQSNNARPRNTRLAQAHEVEADAVKTALKEISADRARADTDAD